MRPNKILLRTFLGGAFVALALLGTLVFGLSSETGLRLTAELAQRLSGGRLSLGTVSGRLLGPLDLSELTWADDKGRWQIEQIHLDWQAAELLSGRLHIRQLDITRITAQTQPDPTPPAPPTQLRLPLALQLDQARISEIRLANLPAIEDLHFAASSDGQTHRLQNLTLTAGNVALAAAASLDGQAPFVLQGEARIKGQLESHPLALLINLDGTLHAPRIQLQAQAGLRGEGEVLLAPFASQVLSHARINLRDIDPAAWAPGAPKAQLDLELALAPDGRQGFVGPLRLNNRQAGRLDQQALPMLSLRSELHLDPQQVHWRALRIELPGGASLEGESDYGDGLLQLVLTARQLDLSRLHASLHPTRLNGSLNGSIATDRQQLQLDLADSQFRAEAEIAQQAGRLNLKQLRLTAGSARLQARGELQLAERRSFSGEGELANFDPARFGRFPSARLNLHWTAQGQLGDDAGTPRQFTGNFAFQDSRLAGQVLNGQGEIRTDGQRSLQTDLWLQAGTNRLQAQGRLGQADDRLQLRIDAPELKPYGIAGGLQGQIELSGALQQPGIKLHLQSPHLDVPGRGRLEALQLSGQFTPDPAAPFTLELRLGKFEIPEHPELLRDLKFSLDGKLGDHRLDAHADIERAQQIQLSARGNLKLQPGWRWQGQLLELRSNSRNTAHAFALREPAPLDVGQAGGQIGPLRLHGKTLDWQAELLARSDPNTLNLTLNAQGGRLGRLRGELQSPALAAWQVDRQKPWRGQAELHSDDLAWLGELLGEGWQTGGQLGAELKLSGSLDRPLLNGQVTGQELLLKRPEQGLFLNHGQLALLIERNLLRVRQAAFDSQLQALPRALRQRDGVTRLTQAAGRVGLQGELRLERDSETGWLDWRLDRLGALQTSDQWLLLSGEGRIDWQSGKLGARGKIQADAGYWALAPAGAPSLSDDVVVRRPGQERQEAARTQFDLDLAIGLGQHFLFSGAGLNARLDGDLRLRASGRDLPRTSGNIRVRDGRFEAYGQRLEIERGNLNFQGLPDNPALDVRALRKGLSVEAGVQVSGTAQRPIVKLVSEPEVPDAEKLAWLVLGHGPEQMGAGDASLLLGAAGGLLGNNAGGLVQQLRQNFGFDELGVRQGAVGDNGSRRQSSRIAGGSSDSSGGTSQQIFSVGKRLSANTVLSYEQALGKAESIVKLTVNLSRSIALVGRAGSDNAIDLFWTRRFGGKADTADQRPPR